jgi:uncharacterized protein (TIGR03083 family)
MPIMAASPWPLIHAERKALAEDLANLTKEQWATPSLCADWTVHDLLAHQVATAVMTPPKFLVQLAAAGFNFKKMSQKDVEKHRAGGPAATLERFRAVETWTKSPPGPGDSWLGEAIVHSEDIRRPLGIKREYPLGSVTRVLDFYKGSNLIVGTKNRIAGLQLKATDTDWSHGTGDLVEGPALSLLLAAVGRKAALDDLTGPGVETLRNR